jgi:hypothetical protein
MKKLLALTSLILGTCTFLAQAATDFQVASGDWNTAGNWSGGVPGTGDTAAELDNGGTLNVTATPTVNDGTVGFEINNSGANANTVNWNPGAASTALFKQLRVGDTSTGGSAVFNHISGRINIGTGHGEAFRVGNQGSGTYIMSGNSIVGINNAFRVGSNNQSDGTLIMNDNSQILDTVNNNGEPRVGGDSANAKGTLIMNSNSFIDTRGNFRLGNNNTGTGTLIMSGTSHLLNRNEFRVGYSGTGFVDMTDSSTLTFGNGSNNDFRIGRSQSGRGTVTMDLNATIKGSGTADDVSIGDQGDGFLVMNGQSKFTDVRNFGIADNHLTSTGDVTMNGSSSIEARVNFQVGRVGAGTITLNDNAQISALTTGPVRLGANDGANGVIIMNGAGSGVNANGNIDVASVAGRVSTALFDQNNGTVYVSGGLNVGNADVGNAATYNLDGGTLKANNITVGATGVFNWGAGVLTVRQVNENASGNGSAINFTGQLETGAGSNAASTLQLGDLYKDGGTRSDRLAVSGALLLTSTADVLDFWDNIQHLRGNGATITTGEIQLISAASVAGTFDNVIAPGADGTFFRTWSAAERATLGITSANDLTRNRGAVIYRADGVYFAYNVSGQIPEPATGMFLLFGTLMLRGISVFRRNNRTRKMLVEIG